MQENKPKKPQSQFSFELDAELHKLFNATLGKRGEKGVRLLTAFVQDYVKDVQGRPAIEIACPICHSELSASAEGVEILSTGPDPATIQVPTDLRDLIEAFIRFALNPHIEDKTLRDLMVDIILRKTAYAGNVSASHGTTL